jgi:hypothetical protein
MQMKEVRQIKSKDPSSAVSVQKLIALGRNVNTTFVHKVPRLI